MQSLDQLCSINQNALYMHGHTCKEPDSRQGIVQADIAPVPPARDHWTASLFLVWQSGFCVQTGYLQRARRPFGRKRPQFTGHGILVRYRRLSIHFYYGLWFFFSLSSCLWCKGRWLNLPGYGGLKVTSTNIWVRTFLCYTAPLAPMQMMALRSLLIFSDATISNLSSFFLSVDRHTAPSASATQRILPFIVWGRRIVLVTPGHVVSRMPIVQVNISSWIQTRIKNSIMPILLQKYAALRPTKRFM